MYICSLLSSLCCCCVKTVQSSSLSCYGMRLCLLSPCSAHSLYTDSVYICSLSSSLSCWGRNSSVGSAWARCPQCRGFDPPLGTFSGRGDFPLGVNMGSNSIPPKTPSDESINRGLVCAHMHFIARTQKILTFMS